jgi:hypothetical protein
MLQTGTGNKKRLRWMMMLLAATALLAIYDIATPVKTASAPATGAADPRRLDTLPKSHQEARLHLDLLPLNPQNTYEFSGRNIFRMLETTESRKLPPATTVLSTGFPPPVAQTLQLAPLKFYGFADKSNESRRVFLQDNEEVFVVKLGDTVERRYKVVEVSRDSVTIQDALHNDRQVIPIIGR